MRRTIAAAVFGLTLAAGVAGAWRFAHATGAQPQCAGCPMEGAKSDSKTPSSFTAKPAPGTKARCPVSGEEFTVKDKTATATYNGRVYAFCCPDCKPDFEKNPAKYAK